jgi:predicted translation initiation factor SUI1
MGMFFALTGTRILHMEHQKKFRSLSDLDQLIEPRLNRVLPLKDQHNGKGSTVHVLLDTHGRKGKSVTLVSGLRHNPTTMEEIARILKQYCGAGGTVKEGKIEIQGDQRERVSAKLRELNYKVE